MFNQEDITVANKTSRNNGAVGKNAITPRKVREYVDSVYDKKDTLILDFGAGKAAAHTRAMLADGYLVTAYEFGENIDPRFHNELALMQQYHIVYASNVLNVQSGYEMARATIKQVSDVLFEGGEFFANYPASPRKSDMKPKEMVKLLLEQFDTVTRVGGTASAPLWQCEK
jgi:hypothetical protein